jgi:AbrB family looped-hinge helix DNA binding protein
MAKEKKESCGNTMTECGCCRVEALVSVDERGQMILPKELRDKAEIHPGDKLAVTALEKGGKVCCLFMIKAEDLTGLVTNMLGPMMQEITK